MLCETWLRLVPLKGGGDEAVWSLGKEVEAVMWGIGRIWFGGAWVASGVVVDFYSFLWRTQSSLWCFHGLSGL